jgi:hypothetical protein
MTKYGSIRNASRAQELASMPIRVSGKTVVTDHEARSGFPRGLRGKVKETLRDRPANESI